MGELTKHKLKFPHVTSRFKISEKPELGVPSITHIYANIVRNLYHCKYTIYKF